MSRGGAVDWLCWPRFDSEACLAALLGDREHGCWELTGDGPTRPAGRRYRPGTLVLETDLEVPGGTVRLIDFMPRRADAAAVVRIVVGLRGAPRMRMDLRLRFDYGALPPWSEPTAQGFTAGVGPHRVELIAPVPIVLRPRAAGARFTLAEGQRLAFVLRHSDPAGPASARLDPEAELHATEHAWRAWTGRFDRGKTRWPEAVSRSLITLKALIHQPSGGLVAAPTTSLPEAPGGTKNWDYRFCWLRDSTFTLGALLNAGYHEEALRWRNWLLRAIAGSPAAMRIMYRVDASRHVPEWEVNWLPGYRHAHPVRIGNAAATQFQGDVWGEVLDSLHLSERAGLPASDHADKVQRLLTEHIETVWQQSGSGLWESRERPRPYTYSRAMAWVGVDRFLRGSASRGLDPGERARLEALRDTIHAETCREGWNEALGCFTDYFGGQTLDAGVLLLALTGFLPARDERMVRTVATLRRELGEDGFIRRNKASGDGAPEGAFLACSCWMADCLSMQGDHAAAAAQFERVLDVRNDLGLLSEMYNVPGRHLAGNFPQALTHLGVVNTGLGLSGSVLQRGGG